MAKVFRPTAHVCELNFDDKFKYELPLHEDTLNKIVHAGDRLKTLNLKDNEESVDKAYNAMLDIIDEILGEGEADNIITIYENAGVADAAAVILYIIDSFKEDYSKLMEFEQPANRATRRARR